MTDDALTLTVLREIRDEARMTNFRLGNVETALVETNSRLGNVETALVDLAQQQTFIVRWLKAGTRRDRRMEQDVVKLTARVDAIEARLPTSEE